MNEIGNMEERMAALESALQFCRADRSRLEAERDEWILKAARFRRVLARAEAFEASVSEALNTGDGSYRP